MKRVYKDERRLSTGEQPRTKSARGPGGKPLVVFPLRFTLDFVCSYFRRDLFTGQLSSMLWRARGKVVSWANGPVDVSSCPAPPRPTASLFAAPPRPARSMSGFWIRQVIVKSMNYIVYLHT